MIKKKTNLYIITAFIMLLLVGSVSAYIVEHHPVIGKEALRNTPNSPITQDILPYEDYFHACNELVDISVVGYFQIDTEESDNFLDKLFKAFTFRIGKTYRATHSQNSCLRALEEAETQKERACGYGICAHLVGADSVSHNLGVPGAIKQTRLTNGMVHSIKEIHDKNILTNEADRVYSRQILDLGYEMTPYFERVFVDDPALSEVSIPNLMDFFIVQVKEDNTGGYRLGFRSFFSLPQEVYWAIFLSFFLGMALLGLSIRKLRDKDYRGEVIFTTLFALFIVGFVGTAMWGLYNGNIWSMWESLSQFLFSPAMYFIGGGFVFAGAFIAYRYIFAGDKLKNLPNMIVAIFIISVGALLLTLPGGLDTGNEQALHDLAVKNTEQLLIQGATFVTNPAVGDPVGYLALQEANHAGAGVRTTVLIYLGVLIISILYFTFRRKR